MPNKLLGLCYLNQYQTDKFYRKQSSGWMGHGHCYVENFYFEHFDRKSYEATALLEIGNFCGGSALMWKDYLPKATIVTIDLNYVSHIADSRIAQLVADAYCDSTVNMIKDNYFDFVIDDGSHLAHHQEYFITHYIPKLKDDGVLVIEDIDNIDLAFKLYSLIPQELKKCSQIYDLRHVNDRWDDIAIVIDRGSNG